MLNEVEEAELRVVLLGSIGLPQSSEIPLVEAAKILAKEKQEARAYIARAAAETEKSDQLLRKAEKTCEQLMNDRDLMQDLRTTRELCDSARTLVVRLEDAATRVREASRPKRKPTRSKRPAKRRKGR